MVGKEGEGGGGGTGGEKGTGVGEGAREVMEEENVSAVRASEVGITAGAAAKERRL